MIFLKAILIIFVFAMLGLLGKWIIWHKTTTPISLVEYGRKFCAYTFFITSLSSVHFFVRDDWSNALVKFLIVLIFFPLFAFVIGLIFGFFRLRSATSIFNTLNSKTESSTVSPFESSRASSVFAVFFKQNSSSLLLVILVLITFISAIVYQRAQPLSVSPSISSKWIPLMKLPKSSVRDDQSEEIFMWIDETSVVKQGFMAVAFIGVDIGYRDESGAIFRRFKVEADCSALKYRRTEMALFSEGVDKNLGKLISENKEWVKTVNMRMLQNNPNYVAGSSWQSRQDSVEQINQWSNEKNSEFIVALHRQSVATIDSVCQ